MFLQMIQAKERFQTQILLSTTGLKLTVMSVTIFKWKNKEVNPSWDGLIRTEIVHPNSTEVLEKYSCPIL